MMKNRNKGWPIFVLYQNTGCSPPQYEQMNALLLLWVTTYLYAYTFPAWSESSLLSASPELFTSFYFKSQKLYSREVFHSFHKNWSHVQYIKTNTRDHAICLQYLSEQISHKYGDFQNEESLPFAAASSLRFSSCIPTPQFFISLSGHQTASSSPSTVQLLGSGGTSWERPWKGFVEKNHCHYIFARRVVH